MHPRTDRTKYRFPKEFSLKIFIFTLNHTVAVSTQTLFHHLVFILYYSLSIHVSRLPHCQESLSLGHFIYMYPVLSQK